MSKSVDLSQFFMEGESYPYDECTFTIKRLKILLLMYARVGLEGITIIRLWEKMQRCGAPSIKLSTVRFAINYLNKAGFTEAFKKVPNKKAGGPPENLIRITVKGRNLVEDILWSIRPITLEIKTKYDGNLPPCYKELLEKERKVA